ncbi:hypothetical protein [Lachnospira pectinoschiza]|uniref:Uncharacterized protein n=1 Tax=Lachnospira pectinoschiza TaxID=28052 RepID=A0A1G9TBY2_9FIRM|nr:hypothetical protein [Lachnospira pectinoschiza]SDM45138.1 hypothetical protein SAMN05216544_0294 [Lachnospira pectinoschiza]
MTFNRKEKIKYNKNKKEDKNTNIPFSKQYYEDVKEAEHGQRLAYILALLGVLAYVAFFIFTVFSKKFDINISYNQIFFGVSAITIMIVTVDVIFCIIYRGKIYSKESTKRKYKKEGEVRKNRINCDIFLLELALAMIIVLAMINLYSFSNLLRWAIVVLAISVAFLVFLHLVKILDTKKFGVNFTAFIVVLFVSVILTVSLVNITATYSYENVTVTGSDTYIRGGRHRSRVYEVDFEYSDGRTETIDTTKKIYDKACYLSYGFYLEEVTGIFGLKMHRLCYQSLY